MRWTLANTCILLAKRLGTFNDGSIVHNEFLILLSKYITTCPNGKCLATKCNQTLLSDQTCGCLTKCFIKLLSTSKFYQTRSLFDRQTVFDRVRSPNISRWTGLYKTYYDFVTMIDGFFFLGQCQTIAKQGFKRGSYICTCRRGYYFPESRAPLKAFNGTLIELEHDRKLRGEPNSYEDSFECIRCSIGCDECVDDSPCLYSLKIVIRLTLCALNGVIMGLTVAFAVYVGLHWKDRVGDRCFV